MQNVRGPRRSDGSVMKELTDGQSYIKAIFTTEAMKDYKEKWWAQCKSNVYLAVWCTMFLKFNWRVVNIFSIVLIISHFYCSWKPSTASSLKHTFFTTWLILCRWVLHPNPPFIHAFVHSSPDCKSMFTCFSLLFQSGWFCSTQHQWCFADPDWLSYWILASWMLCKLLFRVPHIKKKSVKCYFYSERNKIPSWWWFVE